MADGALTIRVRRGSQTVGSAAAFAFAGLFAYIALTGRGPNSTRFLAPGLWALVAVLVAMGLVMLRRLLQPRFFETVIDANGVRDGAGTTMSWAEVWQLGYTGDGREIWIAPYPEARGRGIDIDVYDSDHDAAEILAAIERFSRAAGRELELPSGLPAGASARSR